MLEETPFSEEWIKAKRLFQTQVEEYKAELAKDPVSPSRIKSEIEELVDLVKARNIELISDLPRILTDKEMGSNEGARYVYDDWCELRLLGANRLLVIEAVGEQLGIANQFITHYLKHSPLFVHPGNIALAATAER